MAAPDTPSSPPTHPLSLYVGGSGISYGLSVLQDLVHQAAIGRSRVRHVELVWTIQDPAGLVPLIPVFTSIIQGGGGGVEVGIQVFYTRATPGVVRITKDYLLPGLSLTPGRPKLEKVLDGIISKTSSLPSSKKEEDEEKLCGVVVGCCGPLGMGDEVAKAVRNVQGKGKGVGGVEVCEE